jgi:hypothetical protein
MAFLALMLLFYPFRAVFEFDPDEGINLMKAVLLRNGYPLYASIWSDQPPVLTYLLAALFRLSGPNVNTARVLILLLSTGLVWAYIQFLRMVWGNVHALAGLILLLIVPSYLKLSLSVMIGLPSIAFAMLALLALACWHKTGAERWLALSAAAMCLSVFTKIFTGFLVPIFLAGILLSGYAGLRERKNWRSAFRPPVVWLGVFTGLSTLLLFTLVGIGHLDQLLLPHLYASQLDTFRQSDSTLTLWYHLQQSWVFLLLAALGTAVIFMEKRWLGLYPLAWMVAALVLLAEHAPVWYHQVLLVTIPSALLAAGGVGEAIYKIVSLQRSGWKLSPAALVHLATIPVFITALLLHAPATLRQFSPDPVYARDERRPRASENRFMARIEKFAPQTHWIVTDMPMYAFRAGLPIPPNLVVFTTKRLFTGFLPDEELRETIRKYNPEQVLLGRYEYPALDEILARNYRLAHQRNGVRIYIRKDL